MLDMPELDLENVFDGEFHYEYKGVAFGGWRNRENDWGMYCYDNDLVSLSHTSKEASIEWAKELVDNPRH